MTKPITEKEIQAARAMLERTRAQVSPEDHARLVELVETVAELRTMVIEYDGDDDDVLDEQFLVQAVARVRARLRKPT